MKLRKVTEWQDPEKVGTLWNTVSARLRGATSELEDLGEEQDQYVESTSKLQDLVKAYTGFDIMTDKNNYKDLYDIVLGIGQAWKDMEDIERAALAEALGGKRNARGLIAIFDNLDTLQNSYQTAVTSAGSAAEEQEHFAEGVEFSINRAKASLQELAYDFLSSDFLKLLIDVGTKVLNIIDGIVDGIGSINTVLLSGGLFTLFKGLATNKGLFSSIIESLSISKLGGSTGNTIADVLGLLGLKKGAKGKIAKEAGDIISGGLNEAVSDTLSKDVGKVPIFSYSADIGQSAYTAGVMSGGEMASGMSAGLAAAAPAIAAVAIPAVVAIVGKLAYDKYMEAARQAATDAAARFSDTQSNAEGYRTQYTDLRSQLKQSTSEAETISIKQQIVALQKEIVSAYGDQASGIDLVNGGLTEQLNIIDQIANKELSNVYEEARKKWEDYADSPSLPNLISTLKDENVKAVKGFDRAYKFMTQDQTFDLGFLSYSDKEYTDVKKLADEIGIAMKPVGDTGDNILSFKGNVQEADETVGEFIKKLHQLRDSYEDGDIDTKGIDKFIKSVESANESQIQKTIGKQQEAYLAKLQDIFWNTTEGTSDSGLLAEYERVVGDLNNASLSDDQFGFEKQQARLVEIQNRLKELYGVHYDDAMKPLVDQMDESIDKSSVMKMNLEDLYDNNGVSKDNPFKDQAKDIKEYIAEFDKMRLTADKFDALTMSVEDMDPKMRALGEAMGLVFDDTETYEQNLTILRSVLTATGHIVEAVADEAVSAEQSFAEFRSELVNDIANIDTMNSAIAESFSGKGLSYSIDENGELVGSIKEIRDAYGSLMKDNNISDATLFERTANGIHLNQNALRALQSELEATNKKRLIDRDLELNEQRIKLEERLASVTRAAQDNDAWNDRVEALKAEIEAIDGDIESVRELSAAYDGATSAYQKWVNAQSMGEEGDMYNAIRDTAMKRGKELYDAGLVGTNEFRSIAQLYSYEDLSTAPIDKIVAAYEDGTKSVNKFFTENTDGLDKFAEETSEMGVGVEKIVDDSGELTYVFDNIDTSAIAKNLGVSVDMVEAIFKRFSDYGFDVQFFDETTLEDLDKINEKLRESQEALEGIGDEEINVGNGKTKKASEIIDFDVSSLKTVDSVNEKFNELSAYKATLDVDSSEYNAVGVLMDQLLEKKALLEQTTVIKTGITASDYEEGAAALTAMQQRLQKIQEMQEIHPEIQLKGDTKLEEAVGQLAGTSSDYQISVGIKPENVGNVDKIIEQYEQNEASINFEVGNVEQPTADQTTAEGVTNYGVGDVETPSKEQTTVEGEVKFKYSQNLLNRLYQQSGITQGASQTVHVNKQENTNITATDSASGVFASVQSAAAAINGLNPTVRISADSSKAMAEIQKVEGEKIKDKKFYIFADGHAAVITMNSIIDYNIPDKKINISVTGNAMTDLTHIQTLRDNLHDKEINIKTVYTTEHRNEANGTAHSGGTARSQHTPSYYRPARYNGSVGNSMINHYRWHAYAGGKWGLEQDEPNALINELGPEIVVRDGSWFILNNGFPTLADSSNSGLPGGLKKGDIIFNHLQTEQILKRGYVTGSHARMAYSGGTAYADGTIRGGSAFKDRVTTKWKKGGTQKKAATPSKPSKPTNPPKSDPKSKGTDNKDDDKKAKQTADNAKKAAEWLDWIEIKINMLDRAIQNLRTTADSTFRTFKDRAKDVGEAIKDTTQQIKNQQAAQKRYQKQANLALYKTLNKKGNVTKNSKSRLSQAEVNAAVNSNLFTPSDTKKLKKTKTKKGYNIKQTTRMLLDYLNNGAIEIDKLNTSTKAGAALKERIDLYKQWRTNALDARDAVKQLIEQERELKKQEFDLIKTDYENRIAVFSDRNDMLNTWIDLRENQGYIAGTHIYQDLVDNEKASLNLMSKEYDELLAKRNEMLKKIPAGTNPQYVYKDSEEWQNMNADIRNVSKGILEARNNIAKYQKEMRQVEWDLFDDLEEKISNITDETEFLINILEESDLFNDKGKVTSEGLATFGLHAIAYNDYIQQAKDYADEIKELDGELEKDKYNQDLIKRRQELIEAQQKAIEGSYKERKAIRDLVEQGIKKQIESMKDAISEYEKLMDSQKDAYDYQRNIEEKAQQIANLRKRIASWSNDDSEEGRVRRQQTQKELKDAEKDLAQTQEERRISQTKEMLNNLQEEYEDFLNEKLEDIDKLIREVINGVNENKNGIVDTLKETATSVGYNITTPLSNILNGKNTLASAIGANGYFENTKTNVATAVNTLKSFQQSMLDSANRIADIVDRNVDKDAKDVVVNAQNVTINSGTSSRSSTTTSSGNRTTTNKKKADDTAKPNYQAKANKADDSIAGGKAIITAINKGKARSKTLTADEKKNKSALWQYIVKKYGRTPTEAIYNEIAKALGVTASKKTTAKQRTAILNALKKAGFATGTSGVKKDDYYWTQDQYGQEMIFRKSDGAMLTRLGKGDMVFTNEMTKTLWNLAKNPEAFTNAGNLIPAEAIGNVNIGDSNFNIAFNLPNVKDSKEFMRELQHSKEFEKFLQTATIGRISGKGSLAKYQTKF